jgi:hypothetical protein
MENQTIPTPTKSTMADLTVVSYFDVDIAIIVKLEILKISHYLIFQSIEITHKLLVGSRF